MAGHDYVNATTINIVNKWTYILADVAPQYNTPLLVLFSAPLLLSVSLLFLTPFLLQAFIQIDMIITALLFIIFNDRPLYFTCDIPDHDTLAQFFIQRILIRQIEKYYKIQDVKSSTLSKTVPFEEANNAKYAN